MNLQEIKIAKQLRRNPHVRARKLRVGNQDGMLVIEGMVDSFFAKQMAQESIRLSGDLEDIAEIDNRLQVEWV